MKANISRMKNDIKVLVKEQRITKANRKTVNFVGERIMSPSSANWDAMANRDKLRQMYQAYAILRFKDPKSHELRDGDDYQKFEDNKEVEKLVEHYRKIEDAEETVCSDQS